VTVSVPLGDYERKYAYGTQWYGYEHGNYFFGPDTQAEIADQSLSFSRSGDVISGKSVTLYTVLGGNLETRALPIDQF
jgi:hypothetical protein